MLQEDASWTGLYPRVPGLTNLNNSSRKYNLANIVFLGTSREGSQFVDHAVEPLIGRNQEDKRERGVAETRHGTLSD